MHMIPYQTIFNVAGRNCLKKQMINSRTNPIFFSPKKQISLKKYQPSTSAPHPMPEAVTKHHFGLDIASSPNLLARESMQLLQDSGKQPRKYLRYTRFPKDFYQIKPVAVLM